MYQKIYERFSEDFLEIKDISFSRLSFEQGRDTLKEKMNDLCVLRNQIIRKDNHEEKEILLYCIDTLFELIEKKEFMIISDFCDAVHNIGLFLYVPRWNDGPTWKKSDYYDVFIFPFRQKHGRVYFGEIRNYFNNPEESLKRAKIKKSLLGLIPKKRSSVKINKNNPEKK